MNALEQRWQQVVHATQAIRQQLQAEVQDANEAERLLQERDALLHDLLSESFLSVLGTEEITWLQAKVQTLREEDTLLHKALSAEQQRLHAQLQTGQAKAKAVKAYQKG